MFRSNLTEVNSARHSNMRRLRPHHGVLIRPGEIGRKIARKAGTDHGNTVRRLTNVDVVVCVGDTDGNIILLRLCVMCSMRLTWTVLLGMWWLRMLIDRCLNFNTTFDAKSANGVAALLVLQPQRAIVHAKHARSFAEADSSEPDCVQRLDEVLIRLRVEGSLALGGNGSRDLEAVVVVND